MAPPWRVRSKAHPWRDIPWKLPGQGVLRTHLEGPPQRDFPLGETYPLIARFPVSGRSGATLGAPGGAPGSILGPCWRLFPSKIRGNRKNAKLANTSLYACFREGRADRTSTEKWPKSGPTRGSGEKRPKTGKNGVFFRAFSPKRLCLGPPFFVGPSKGVPKTTQSWRPRRF